MAKIQIKILSKTALWKTMNSKIRNVAVNIGSEKRNFVVQIKHTFSMKQVFDYLELTDIVATVCDKDGIVIYQNAASRKRKGNVMGTSLFKYHKPGSNNKIKHMLESGENYTYSIIKSGKKFFIHQSPWYEEEDGPVTGLIEFFIPLPDEYHTFDRDMK